MSIALTILLAAMAGARREHKIGHYENPPCRRHPGGALIMSKPKPIAVVIPISNGSDPELIEIEDCTEAVGDFPEIDTPCDLSPSGQCEYSWRDNFRACIHCRKTNGLDE